MIRVTYTNSDGIVIVEDFVMPEGSSTRRCRNMVKWRRPEIKIIRTDAIPDEVPPPAGEPRFHVTLKIPGRPDRTILSPAVNHSQATREAMAYAPPGAAVVSVMPHRKPPTSNRKLSEEQIRELFSTSESQASLSRRWGVSRAALYQALAGKTNAHLRPQHLPPGRPSCERCIHYTGDPLNPCDLGFPDPVDLGLGFAADCAVFERQGVEISATA